MCRRPIASDATCDMPILIVASMYPEKGIAMLNDLQDSQTIIVYDGTGLLYDGKVSNIPE